MVNRIAQSTIDIFGMFVVLSRAARSINTNSPSGDHEAALANLFCYEASKRLEANLKDALDGKFVESTKLMTKIAKDLSQHGHTVPTHPLGF